MEEYPFSAQNTTSCLENLRGIADSDRTPDPTPNPGVLLIIIPSGKYSVIDFLPSEQERNQKEKPPLWCSHTAAFMVLDQECSSEMLKSQYA